MSVFNVKNIWFTLKQIFLFKNLMFKEKKACGGGLSLFFHEKQNEKDQNRRKDGECSNPKAKESLKREGLLLTGHPSMEE